MVRVPLPPYLRVSTSERVPPPCAHSTYVRVLAVGLLLVWATAPGVLRAAEEDADRPERPETTSNRAETGGGEGTNEDDGVEVISHGSNESGGEGENGSNDGEDSQGESVEVLSHGSNEGNAQSEDDSEGEGVETISHDDTSSDDEGGEATESGTSTATGTARSLASRFDFRGTWGASTGIDTRWESEEDVAEWRANLGLHLEYDLSSSSRVVLDGELRHWAVGRERETGPNLLVNAAEPRASFEARLGESYVLWRSDHWTFRGGYLVTSWGSTSLVRPGDVVNPVDATNISPTGGGGSTSLPQLAAEIGYVQPNWSIEAVVVPFFEPNRVTVFGRDNAIATPQNPLVGDQFPINSIVERLLDRSLYEEAQPLALSTSVPDEVPKNASVGVRMTATAWNTDVGLGYYFGWDRTPWLAIDEDARSLLELAVEDGRVLRDFDLTGFISRNPEALELTESLSEKQQRGESILSSTYRRRHSIVADVSRYVGPVGVRADVAFSPERTFATGNFESARRTTVFSALGLSYEKLVDDRPLALTLEGYWLRPLPRNSSVNELFVADNELGPEGSELALVGEGLYGLVGAVQWELPFWKLNLQLGAIGDLSNGDVVAGGRLQRRWTSWLQTSIGGTIYEGPPPGDELSVGGLYDQNDQVQMIVSGDF